MIKLESDKSARKYEFSYQGDDSRYTIEVSYKIDRRNTIGLGEEITIGHRGVSCTARREKGEWVSVPEGIRQLWAEIPSDVRTSTLRFLDPLIELILLNAVSAKSTLPCSESQAQETRPVYRPHPSGLGRR